MKLEKPMFYDSPLWEYREKRMTNGVVLGFAVFSCFLSAVLWIGQILSYGDVEPLTGVSRLFALGASGLSVAGLIFAMVERARAKPRDLDKALSDRDAGVLIARVEQNDLKDVYQKLIEGRGKIVYKNLDDAIDWILLSKVVEVRSAWKL